MTMWRIVRILSELLFPVLAAWVFAATLQPEASWAFGRPVKHWAISAIRITSVACFVLGLVIIVTDVLDLAGFIHIDKER
jgi:hypothetical protein